MNIDIKIIKQQGRNIKSIKKEKKKESLMLLHNDSVSRISNNLFQWNINDPKTTFRQNFRSGKHWKLQPCTRKENDTIFNKEEKKTRKCQEQLQHNQWLKITKFPSVHECCKQTNEFMKTIKAQIYRHTQISKYEKKPS